MDYPDESQENELAKRMLGPEAPEAVLESGDVEPVLTSDQLARARPGLQRVVVRDELLEYIVAVVRQTRTEDSVFVGAGPRATQALLLSSRAHAAMEGRDYVTPDDVKSMAVAVFEHRLILRPEHEIEGLTIPEVIERVLGEVAVPR